MCKNKAMGLAGARGRGSVRTSVELVSGTPVDQADREPQQGLLRLQTQAATSTRQWCWGMDEVQLGNIRAGQGSAWYSPGAKAWRLLGLGLDRQVGPRRKGWAGLRPKP